MLWRAASLCGAAGSFAGLTANVPEAVIIIEKQNRKYVSTQLLLCPDKIK